MLERLNAEWLPAGLPWQLIAATAGLFVAALVLERLIKRLIKRAFDGRPADDRAFLSVFWRTERGLVLGSVGWVVWLAALGGAIYIWADYVGRIFAKARALYPPLLRAAVIVIIAAIALKAARALISVVVEKVSPLAESAAARGAQRVRTLQHVFGYGSSIIIVTIAALMLLGTFGIDLKAVLATVGIASVAIGFGAQSLVKDVVSGIFIIIEDQFAVGDVAMINGEGGVVERMTLRVTQLRNTAGMLITIPNGEITMVKNLTSEWSRVDFRIGVAYGTDLDRAMDVLMEEAAGLKRDMLQEIVEEPERLGVDEFGDSSVTLRIWIKTAPLMQWKVQRELNRRVHMRFEKEGIEIPFPQRTLWIKEPREAALAALAGRSAK
jgi:small-conductance mechanosensitive channel